MKRMTITKHPYMTEREIQRDSVKYMRTAGWRVCVTSNGRKTANTRGTPDVLVYLDKGYWLGLEFKKPDGKTTPDQTELENVGAIKVCRSLDDCITYVTEKRIELEPRKV